MNLWWGLGRIWSTGKCTHSRVNQMTKRRIMETKVGLERWRAEVVIGKDWDKTGGAADSIHNVTIVQPQPNPPQNLHICFSLNPAFCIAITNHKVATYYNATTSIYTPKTASDSWISDPLGACISAEWAINVLTIYLSRKDVLRWDTEEGPGITATSTPP